MSFLAAGVLVHLLSDGPRQWNSYLSRSKVVEAVQTIVYDWDLNENLIDVNYSTFKPFVKLLVADHTPQCQYWAVWALANLAVSKGEAWKF